MNYTKEEMLNIYNGTREPTDKELEIFVESKKDITGLFWGFMPNIMTYNVLRQNSNNVTPPENLLRKYGLVSSDFKVKGKSYKGYLKSDLKALYENDSFISDLYDIVNSKKMLQKRYSETISKHKLSEGFTLTCASSDYLFTGIRLESGMGYHYFGDGMYVDIGERGVYSGATRGNWPIGVYLNKPTQKYLAQIRINGKLKHIGRFSSPSEAHEAYKIEKLAYMKVVAEEELAAGNITKSVYEALVNWMI